MTKKFGGLDLTKKIRCVDWEDKRSFLLLDDQNVLRWNGTGVPYRDNNHIFNGMWYELESERKWEYVEESEIEKYGLKDLDYGDTVETQIKKIRDILIYLLEKK